MVSGNLDGVSELVGNLDRKRQDEVPIERRCDPGQSVNPILGAAYLKPRNDGLGGPRWGSLTAGRGAGSRATAHPSQNHL